MCGLRNSRLLLKILEIVFVEECDIYKRQYEKKIGITASVTF